MDVKAPRGLLPEGGYYRLELELGRARWIRVGRLGRFCFPAGRYLYTGSARRGLAARLARHVRRHKPLHWHIDYLRRHARLVGVEVHPLEGPGECELARAMLAQPGAEIVAPGLGSSDCHCPAHLVWAGSVGRGLDGPV